MAPQQFFASIFFAVMMVFILELRKTTNKVKCTFRSRSKKLRTKWVKPQNGERIEFDGGWYYVITECIIHDRTFFGLLPVMLLEFSWRSKYPLDPDTGEPAPETPEMRKNLNKREDIEALEVGSRRATGAGSRVPAFGGGLWPIVLTIGVVASVYLLWQLTGKMDMLGQATNVVQEMLLNMGR